MSRLRRRTVISLAGAAASMSVVIGLAVGIPAASADGPDGPGGSGGSIVMAAVGDISCEPNIPENDGNPANRRCGAVGGDGDLAYATATAQQASAMHPDAVALLGDQQYQVGKLSDFQNSFDLTWGPLKALEHPTPGNHEYYAYTKHGDNEAAQNGVGYFGYFNGVDGNGTPLPYGPAGYDTPTNQGWYSYDVGSWHIISLNAECDSDVFNHDCSTTDAGLLAQETQWLAQDLKNDTSKCTLAYWHQPTFSAITSGANAATVGAGGTLKEGTATDAWWTLLYDAHADLILNGHEHVYARFAPMDPNGTPTRQGIRQFTIGTGGEDYDTLARNTDGTFANPNIVSGEDTAFGVAEFRLSNGAYSWHFSTVAAGAKAPTDYTDNGGAPCHA